MKKFLETGAMLVLLGAIALLGNFVGYRITPLAAIPGMLVLLGLAILGLAVAEWVKIKNIPAIVYISVLGILVTAPFSPVAATVLPWVEKVNFLALATPVLACAGIGLASETLHLKKYGLRLLLVSILVFTGTFLGSALICEMLLRFSPFHP
ncbi:MAG: hypothetical protein HYU64_20905 [Armatimonadetes bacterium]|nr:hypothetical protein [Armatimonadota bacterium]